MNIGNAGPRRIRRTVASAWAATAVVVVLASAAYACTTFRGMMTVTGDGGTSSVAVANYNIADHGYCALTRGAVGHGGLVPSKITIAVAPTKTCAGGNATDQLPDNPTYYVKFRDSTLGFQWTASAPPVKYEISGYGVANSANLCMKNTTTLATFAVSNGEGQVVVNLPSSMTANGLYDDASICVADTNGVTNTYGIMAPIHIVI